MSRSVPEWVGKTPDAKIPDRVRVRVFEKHEGICHLSKRKIRPGELWECDHIIALCNGGEHRESNLAPALVDKHKLKTREDVKEKSRTQRKLKNLLLKREPKIRTGRRFDGTPIRWNPEKRRWEDYVR